MFHGIREQDLGDLSGVSLYIIVSKDRFYHIKVLLFETCWDSDPESIINRFSGVKNSYQ